MRFDHLRIPAADPDALRRWYGSLFGVDETLGDDRQAVRLGETTLQFEQADASPPIHLAVRLLVDAETAVDRLAERATIIPVDGEPSRWFEFLRATAIYFDDAAGNVLEGLCYDGDPRQSADDGLADGEWVDGVTEVGLPAHEPLALVEWLEGTVGLSAWGTPSETFAWVGDRQARFVVVPAGRAWYPTDRDAGVAPISVRLDADAATPDRHVHPTLPYEIVVDER
ncbi:MAG: VOC family protein [Halohasta sp.]